MVAALDGAASLTASENPRLLLQLAGADPGRGKIEVAFTYDIKIDMLPRIEDLAGQVLRIGVYGPPVNDEVLYECSGPNELTPGVSFAVQADGNEVAFRHLELEFFDSPWGNWLLVPSEPGSVEYDPATMWQISGFGHPCSAEVILRFPEDEAEIRARMSDAPRP